MKDRRLIAKTSNDFEAPIEGTDSSNDLIPFGSSNIDEQNGSNGYSQQVQVPRREWVCVVPPSEYLGPVATRLIKVWDKAKSKAGEDKAAATNVAKDSKDAAEVKTKAQES